MKRLITAISGAVFRLDLAGQDNEERNELVSKNGQCVKVEEREDFHSSTTWEAGVLAGCRYTRTSKQATTAFDKVKLLLLPSLPFMPRAYRRGDLNPPICRVLSPLLSPDEIGRVASATLEAAKMRMATVDIVHFHSSETDDDGTRATLANY